MLAKMVLVKIFTRNFFTFVWLGSAVMIANQEMWGELKMKKLREGYDDGSMHHQFLKQIVLAREFSTE